MTRKGVHDRGSKRRALEIDRKANCVIWGVLSPGAGSMPNERISISKLKQLIALQSSNLSVRALCRALGRSVGGSRNICGQVRASAVAATEAESLSEV